LLKVKIAKENNLEEIVSVIKKGGVVVLPTDTVYGLVCDAGNNQAIEKIFEIKKRDKNKPLPIFVEDIKMAKTLAQIDENQERVLGKSWPGAVTFVLEAKDPLLSPLVYKNNTIAMRAPNHGLVKEIFKKFKKPLAQTSANISGQPALTKINEIIEDFSKSLMQPDLIVDAGNLSEKNPSIIIDLTKEKNNILRK